MCSEQNSIEIKIVTQSILDVMCVSVGQMFKTLQY